MILWNISASTNTIKYYKKTTSTLKYAETQTTYILSCTDCMQNKSMISKPVGLLYPLSVSNNYFDSINIDFISPLPKVEGYNMLMTVTD